MLTSLLLLERLERFELVFVLVAVQAKSSCMLCVFSTFQAEVWNQRFFEFLFFEGSLEILLLIVSSCMPMQLFWWKESFKNDCLGKFGGQFFRTDSILQTLCWLGGWKVETGNVPRYVHLKGTTVAFTSSKKKVKKIGFSFDHFRPCPIFMTTHVSHVCTHCENVVGRDTLGCHLKTCSIYIGQLLFKKNVPLIPKLYPFFWPFLYKSLKECLEAQNFDFSSGTHFWTYVSPRVLGVIQWYLAWI